MNPFLNGIGAVLTKVATYIPGHVENLKKKRQELIDERNRLLDTYASAAAGYRIIAINEQLQKLNAQIRDKATD